MNYSILNRDDLPLDGNSHEFVGSHFDHTGICIIWVDMPPGEGVRLHQHPYKEVFIVQEGVSRFTVGSDTVEAQAGQVIIVAPDTPHKFMNAGVGQLRQIDIHLNESFVTDWLED